MVMDFFWSLRGQVLRRGYLIQYFRLEFYRMADLRVGSFNEFQTIWVGRVFQMGRLRFRGRRDSFFGKVQQFGQFVIVVRQVSFILERSKFFCIWMSVGGVGIGLVFIVRQAVSSRSRVSRFRMVLGFFVFVLFTGLVWGQRSYQFFVGGS